MTAPFPDGKTGYTFMRGIVQQKTRAAKCVDRDQPVVQIGDALDILDGRGGFIVPLECVRKLYLGEIGKLVFLNPPVQSERGSGPEAFPGGAICFRGLFSSASSNLSVVFLRYSIDLAFRNL